MLSTIFITVIYQPFLNILIGIYWLLGFVSENADMGVAVILLTFIIRFLLLPISIASEKAEAGREAIAQEVAEIEERFASDPVRRKEEKRKVMHGNTRVLIGELFNLAIQIMIALMLWKMFETGLPGEDWHLIYPFMPEVAHPFNLLFLGKYDLSHPDLTLNFLQSFMIFIFETVSALTSRRKVTRGDIIRMQFFFPVVSFLIFIYLPAGKKLFVITTLFISTVLSIVKFIYRKFKEYEAKMIEKQEQAANEQKIEEEKILVEVKE